MMRQISVKIELKVYYSLHCCLLEFILIGRLCILFILSASVCYLLPHFSQWWLTLPSADLQWKGYVPFIPSRGQQ